MEETFRYKVELDTQGLAGQLAGVRDVVSQGLGQAAGGAVSGVQLAGGGINRLSSDLIQGQQFIAASFPAQSMAAMPQAGLAAIPGMPQTFMQEVAASRGISRPPVGVFGSQQQLIGNQRLQERIQMGVAEGIGTIATTGGSMLAGAALGTMIGGPAGTVVGLGLGILGDVALRPVMEGVEARMADRSRIQQVFGFNKFSDDNRMVMSDFMRQRFTKSIFSPEEFNNIMPLAARAGFFKGVSRGDVSGFKQRFAQAEESLTEGMYALQVTGPEGMAEVAETMRGFGRMGLTNAKSVGRHFQHARVIAQDMSELGEYATAREVVQQQMEAGSGAMQMGMAARHGIATFERQASMVNRLRSQGQLSDDDLSLMGGGTGEAANRLTQTLMATQRHPVFRSAALAFGEVSSSGAVSVNQAAMAAGGGTFGAMSERLSQQLGTETGGTTRMMTLMANQGKLQGDMMANQGQMLRGMTDDILRQANLEVTDGTRQFVMQKMFGITESESRALTAGLPMEKADSARLTKDANQFDREVKGAIKGQQESIGHKMDELTRGMVESMSKPLDEMSNSISKSLVPAMNKAVEHLATLAERTGSTSLRSHSPISAGPIDFAGNDGKWMVPPDPMSLHGFRAVSESRMYPAPLSLAPVHAQKLGYLGSDRPRESMAG